MAGFLYIGTTPTLRSKMSGKIDTRFGELLKETFVTIFNMLLLRKLNVSIKFVKLEES